MIFSMIYVMTSAVIIGHRMTKYAIGSYCTLGSIMESAVGNLCFIGCTCFKSWNAAEWANSTWDTAKGIEEPAATEMHIRYFLVLCCVFVLFVIMVHNVAFFRPAFHIMTHAVQIGQVVAALDIWTWSLASVPEAQLRPRKWRVKTFRLVLCHELMHFIELMMQGILSFFLVHATKASWRSVNCCSLWQQFGYIAKEFARMLGGVARICYKENGGTPTKTDYEAEHRKGDSCLSWE